jgi:hypothetical protein
VDIHLTFVIGGTAGVKVTVADYGLKWGGFPEIERIGRLDVVMPVTENRWLAGSVHPIRVDERMALGFDHLNVFEPGGTKVIGNESSRPAYVFPMLRERRNARNPQESEQLVKKSLLVRLDVCRD